MRRTGPFTLILWIVCIASVSACEQFGEPPAAQPTGAMCGGIAGLACAGANDYCAMEEGQCRIADMSGVCRVRPQFCTMDYRPVCGCDGKTYGNKCGAAAAGVNVLYKGECRKD